jgi:methionyl-tRNA synthetase
VWVHGWLLTGGGERMSKSRGNFLDPHDSVAAFGSDGARYVTLREVAFDRDTEVSWDSFVRRYNADLANDFGNLVNRTVTMAGRYLGGERPHPRPVGDSPLGAAWADILATYTAKLDALLLHDALAALWEFVGMANRFVESEQPWALAKAAKAGDAGAPAAEAHLAAVLGDLVEAARLVSLAVAPFMPSIAPRALDQLGHAYPYAADGNGGPPVPEALGWGAATGAGGQLGTATPLFPRLDSEVVAADGG